MRKNRLKAFVVFTIHTFFRVTILEPFLAHQGWNWRWEDSELVLEVSGWVQPEEVLVAIQAGLFG